MIRIERNARLLREAGFSEPWASGGADLLAAASLTLAPIEPDAAMVDQMAKAILAKVPLGYGMTLREAREYARAAWRAGIGPSA